MRPVLAWIKSNPLTVASIVVVLLALGFLGWIHSRGKALEADMAQRDNQGKALQALMSRPVQLPSADPDAPLETHTITINPVAIDQLKQLYGRMDDEYTKVFQTAVEINQGNHHVLVEKLFPDPNAEPGLPFQARDAYVEALRNLVKAPDEAGGRVAGVRLDAGVPPTQEEVNVEVMRVDSDFRNAPGMIGATLKPEDEQILYKEKSGKAMEVLLERAKQIHIYAGTELIAGQQNTFQPGSPLAFPFQVQPWALTSTGELPRPHQLWEGQLELWIQEDIAKAIGIANQVEDDSQSVLTAPIKRLLRVEVVPGYIGLHTRGGLYADQNPLRADGSYPAPAGGQTGEANRRFSDNFYISPTGRASNALYDVRHVKLSVIADVQQLPAFFNALARANFMTVLKVDMQDVDEYEELKNGFVYGTGDVAKVDMVIETIWLRDWTQNLMPKITRQYVGIDPPTDLDATAPAGGMMGPMDYGGYDPAYGGYGGYGPPGGAPPGYGPPPAQ